MGSWGMRAQMLLFVKTAGVERLMGQSDDEALAGVLHQWQQLPNHEKGPSGQLGELWHTSPPDLVQHFLFFGVFGPIWAPIGPPMGP